VLIALSVLVIALAVTSCTKTESRVGRSDVQGRSSQVFDTQSVEEISGVLSYHEPDWHLETSKGSVLLGLGNRAFLESTNAALEEGKNIVVKGYRDSDEFTVVSLVVDGDEVAIRTENGTPLWSGGGASSDRGSDSAGRGNNRGEGQGRGRITDESGRSENI
jgi:hypothetical protein